MYFDVALKNCTDSRALYLEVKKYGLNVTDLGHTVYVYGQIDEEDEDTLIRICVRYGDIE